MGCGILAQRIGGELLMDYLTNDADLTAVADAIREKGGTSAALVWPSGYVDAIDAIETGGGGSVETASVSLYHVDSAAPANIYYTDENMVVQHSTNHTLLNVQIPVGSIIYCQGSGGPTKPTHSNVGITPLYVQVTARTLNAAYEVTG